MDFKTLSPQEMFEGIRDKQVVFSDFYEWLDDLSELRYEDGFVDGRSHGFDDGYQTCLDNNDWR